MAFTKTTLITRIRRLLHDNPFQDICTEAMDTTETGLDVGDRALWAVGNIIEFTDDGEQCLVTATGTGAGALTVVRNFNFSVTTTAGTGTSHSINTAILKTPVFAFTDIVDAIEQSIQSLWPYVYKKITATVTPVATEQYFDAATAVLELSSVIQLTTSVPDRPVFYGPAAVRLVKNMPTGFSGSTTGASYHFPGGFDNLTNTVLVNGIGKITDTVTSGDYDDLTDGTEVDCVTFLAVSRLVAMTDISRATQEDIEASLTGVNTGQRTGLAAYWEAKGTALRRQWEMDLATRLPRGMTDRGYGHRRRRAS